MYMVSTCSCVHFASTGYHSVGMVFISSSVIIFGLTIVTLANNSKIYKGDVGQNTLKYGASTMINKQSPLYYQVVIVISPVVVCAVQSRHRNFCGRHFCG